MTFLALLACFVDSPKSTVEKTEPEDCTAKYLESTKKSRPQDWFDQLPDNTGQIVFLAEHHGQAHQIEMLTQFIEIAAEKEENLIFAAEWLPEKSESRLNQLLQEPEWNSKNWWAVIEDKYFIAPLMLEEYEQPIRRIHQLNKDRSTPVKVVGLAPDCHFSSLKTAVEVNGCLRQREDTMTARIREAFTPKSEALLLISSGYRHAQLSQTDTVSATPLAQRLATDYSVKSILMNGIESGSRQTCGGLFSTTTTSTIYSLFELPNASLTTACLSNDAPHQTILLSEAFTDLWITPLPWKTGRNLPVEAIESMSKETLESWSKFQFDLLKEMDIGANSEAWKQYLDNQYPPLTIPPPTAFDCSSLNEFSQ